MKKFKFIAVILLIVSSYSVTAQTCPSGTSSSRFTSLGQARTVTVAGVYYFNLNGTTFSTYVDANGYVMVAHDYGNGSGNLPQGTSLTNTSRGILSPAALARLTDANEARISHSGGNLDVTTNDATVLSRLRSNTTIHRGATGNAVNNNWTGTESTAITVDANCDQGGTSLHQNIVWICGNSSGMHWAPGNNYQRIRYSNGSFSGEIGNSESLTLWVRANADTNCYTSVPDDAFESYLEANGMGNGIANDNYVSTNNISSVTFLNISNQGISDLTGIADFTAITFLIATTNNFSTVDLSNNTNLQQVFIGSNPMTSINVNGLTSLTGLDVSNSNLTSVDVSTNTALESLWLTGITTMSSVDVSNNTALKTMHLAKTRNFLSIDLRNNTSLTKFYAFESDVESVDLKNGNNTSITTFTAYDAPISCVSVDDVAYSTSNWTSIDDSSAFRTYGCDETYVPDNNFEAFLEANGMGNGVANDDAVTTANISSVTELALINQGVADLTGIERFTSLQSIGMILTNPITTADFSNNTNLTEIIVQTSTLTSINVDNLSSLTNLALNNANISSIDLSDLTALTDLNLSSSSISTIDLSNNPALRELYMPNSSLSSLDVSTNTNLRQLDISNTNVSSLDISSNLQLDRLDIANLDNITTLDLRNFANINFLDISNMDNLQWVDLRNGNNTTLTTEFRATNTPNLKLISVEDRAYSITTWGNVDDSSIFQELDPETYVPDGDFEAFLESNGMGNGTYNDDYVNTGSIITVTSLNISGQLIQDLTGIEGFVALETLNVSNNSINTIDVSNLTSLEFLNANGTSLTSIDVSNNTALKTLLISNTSISSLGLSTNVVLESLNVSQTSISTLDVSNNIELITLDAGNANNLTTLDLTSNRDIAHLTLSNTNSLQNVDFRNGNNNNIITFFAQNTPSLTCISVDNVAVSTANWTSIDDANVFRKFGCDETYVPDDNFEAFLEGNGIGNGIANDDAVTTANISSIINLNVDNQSISDMTGIEGFTALEKLEARNNNFTSIDLSSNTNLRELLLRDNSLTTLDVTALTALESIGIKNNPSITSLDVSTLTVLDNLAFENTGISSIDVSNNLLLNRLDMDGTNITTLDLTQNTALTILEATNSTLSYLDVKNGNNASITFFDITNTNLSCVNVDDAAYSTTNWTSKDVTTSYGERCYETNVPDDNFENYLETHDASGNTVSVGDASSMGNGIANDNYVTTANISSVTALNVTGQSISDMTGIEGFIALEDLDAANNNFSTIDLSSNTALIDIEIRDNSSLTAIDVSVLTSLEVLNVNGTNGLTSIDVSNNPALKTLQVTSNQVTKYRPI